MGGLLHLVQRGGAWAGWGPAQSLLAVPNVTAHPSTASVPITVLQYNGPLLRGFNMGIKGLNNTSPQGVNVSVGGIYLFAAAAAAAAASAAGRPGESDAAG